MTSVQIFNARILNERDNKINQLTTELAASNRLRLSVKERNCGIDAMPGNAGSSQERIHSTSESGSRNEGAIPETFYSATENSLNNGLDQVWQELEKLKIYAWDLTERCRPRFNVVNDKAE
ncbi:hypothetical protein [Nitrosomonas communis]|uniref:Uncharacterized protein n=1 Tax=Nitrosomonas communis TaxID=44574 RepID=A0A1I4QAL4_9PROT|nr:hypothetical protein [Nitrosomonas communis]SFM36693.1 hypothetical protein SAMN05421863_102542 [Nitrosomonas communis]